MWRRRNERRVTTVVKLCSPNMIGVDSCVFLIFTTRNQTKRGEIDFFRTISKVLVYVFCSKRIVFLGILRNTLGTPLVTLNYSTRKPTATFRHRRSCPRHLAPSISWRRSVHPNVLSLRPRRSPPGALHNSTKNCYANSFQNKCENNFARKARSVEVLNQPSNRKRDSITNHPPPSPNP